MVVLEEEEEGEGELWSESEVMGDILPVIRGGRDQVREMRRR